MQNKFKKFYSIILLLLMAFTLIGCDLLENKKPDETILNIDTAEDGYDFIIGKVNDLGTLKASVKASIISLPIEGYVDWSNKVTYVQFYKTENNEKVIKSYYYFKDDLIYMYENKDGLETYKKISDVKDLNLDVNVNDYIKVFEMKDLDFSKVTFRNDQYQFVLSFKLNNEDIELIYSYNKIKIVVSDLATITLSKDTSNFFDNLDIDLDKFTE